MSSSGFCRRCQQPLEVGSASEICATCVVLEDTSEATPPPMALPVDTPRPAGDEPGTASPPFTNSPTPPRESSEATAAVGVVPIQNVPLPSPPPGYDILARLGGGGMGDVFLAVEHATGRRVAMKFLRSRGSRTAMDRFLVEVRALAALDHPHIVRVHATDFLRSDPYYTMEFVPGGSLGKWIEAHGLPTPHEAARLILIVARAVQAAHERGILHRDLKPSNILVATAESADAHAPRLVAKVSDFGLAKRLEHDDDITLGSGPIGTPGFMPPEQISGRNGDIGPTADVYGLGATLFAVLTGQAPFGRGEHTEVMRRVLEAPVPRPRALRPDVPAELDGIAVKCLEKDPAERYPSAAALADDLERFLAGAQPAAPTMTRWRRTRRWCGRHRRRFVAAAAAVLVAAGLIATGMAMKPHTRTAEEEFAAIERELDAGQEVVLVGPTSLPRWHRWAVSEGAIAPSAARDGTYDLQSHGLAFLELLPDPRCERYRFRGELRHVGGNQGGVTAVGLYVGFENVVAANTGHSVHPVLLAWYEDVFSGTDQIKIAKKQPVQHIARLEFATPFCAFNHYPYMRHHSSNDERGLTFIPQERPPVPWRTIELHVSPEGVEMFWATDGGPLVRAHRVSASDLALDRRDIREDVQARELGTLLGDRSVAIPEWNPRRSLGIWVQRSTVSFRNVSIVPLP